MASAGSTPPTGAPRASTSPRASRMASALLRRVRAAVASTIGRVWLATLALKLLVEALGTRAHGWVRVVDSIATIVVAIGLWYLLFRLLASLQRRFLWRVRRKLVLSYLLIGFVPILLLGSFFVLSGTLLLLTVSSSLVQTGLDAVVEDATGIAAAAAVDLGSLADPRDAEAVLARRLQVEAARYPGASVALVADAPAGPTGAPGATTGPWDHAPVPRVSPAWLARSAGGMLIAEAGGQRSIVARGAHRVRLGAREFVVVVDLPLSEAVVARVQAASGTVLIDIGSGSSAGAGAGASAASSQPDTATVQLSPPAGPLETAGGLPWVSFLDLLDWSSGEHSRGALSFQVRPSVLYGLLVQGGEFNLAGVLVVSLVLIGLMFLTIEAVALVMGFALAKSITGAVHELFMGTERVRRGDLSHRIQVDSKVQRHDR
jgi:sigma-B regulation protein RsbU (phosphoserine phosphatase)